MHLVRPIRSYDTLSDLSQRFRGSETPNYPSRVEEEVADSHSKGDSNLSFVVGLTRFS